MAQVTRWRWRYRLPGGKWKRDPLPMTDEEAARSAKAYEPVGVRIEMERIPGSECAGVEREGIEPLTSWLKAPGDR